MPIGEGVGTTTTITREDFIAKDRINGFSWGGGRTVKDQRSFGLKHALY